MIEINLIFVIAEHVLIHTTHARTHAHTHTHKLWVEH